MSKIVLVTSGQPSTNPRMLKEYITLKKAGYKVKVIYAYWTEWAVKTDEELLNDSSVDKNDFILVGGSPARKKLTYFLSRVIYKVSRFFSFTLAFSFFDEWAYNRRTLFLGNAAKKEKADLYIAHNLAALPAAVKAAQKWKVPCGFDAEDFHSGEFPVLEGKEFELTRKLEKKYISKCNHITAASPLIAEKYQELLNLKEIVVINNVFSLSHAQPFKSMDENSDDELRLLWFSQNIGPNRGLEDVIASLELLKDYKIKLLLIGESSPEFRNTLVSRLSKKSMVEFMDPVKPDAIFHIAASAHIGIASEQPYCENRDICLTNKLFTYLLAGNCIAASNTKGQEKFLNENPGIGFLYNINNPTQLAGQIKKLYNNRKQLNQYRTASRNLAFSTFNWELESNKLTGLINKLIPAA